MTPEETNQMGDLLTRMLKSVGTGRLPKQAVFSLTKEEAGLMLKAFNVRIQWDMPGPNAATA
jgi:hypothetical protein